MLSNEDQSYAHLATVPQNVRRILVVDDENAMCSIITFAMRSHGFQTVSASSAEQAEHELSAGRIDLVILDVMLPGKSGIDLCRHIQATSSIPVILLTARGEAGDRVAGLEAGADDYVVKPFSPRELALRVEAVLRRGHVMPVADSIRIGELQIDRSTMRVTVAGRAVDLSASEFRLLAVLSEHLGATVRWQDLYDRVWQQQPLRGARAMVKTTVYRLRARLGLDPGSPPFILTVRGIGYRLVGPTA